MTTSTSGGVDLDQVLVVAERPPPHMQPGYQVWRILQHLQARELGGRARPRPRPKRGVPAPHKQRWCVLSPPGLLFRAQRGGGST